jgi:hypothetical protein
MTLRVDMECRAVICLFNLKGLSFVMSRPNLPQCTVQTRLFPHSKEMLQAFPALENFSLRHPEDWKTARK